MALVSSSHHHSRLLALPPELLEHVAFHLATRPPNLGSPAALLPLLSTSRRLNQALSPSTNSALYARIARAKFTLPRHGKRRLKADTDASLLPTFCRVLRVIRSGDPHHPQAEWALQIAYGLLLVDDTAKPDLSDLSYAPTSSPSQPPPTAPRIGKNKRQLGWAGARAFALRWIRSRMWENRNGDREPSSIQDTEWRPEWSTEAWRVGWPRDSNATASALWLLWFFESKETLAAEPDNLRQNVMAQLLPFVVAPFRYASALAPPHHYTIPLLDSVRAKVGLDQGITVPTFHGDYPIYALGKPSRLPIRRPRSLSSKSKVLGPRLLLPRKITSRQRKRLLSAPPARLLFFARVQAGSRMGIPPHLPVDRADADRRWLEGGNTGPPIISLTQADILEKNTRPIVRFERQVVARLGSSSLEDIWAVDPAVSDASESTRARWAIDLWRGRVCRGYGEDLEVASSDESESGSSDEDGQRTATPRSTQIAEPEPGRIGRVYELGSFAGLWAGTMMMPGEQAYTNVINTVGGALPPGGLTNDDFVAVARPVYMRIREHWSFHPNIPAPPASADSATNDEGLGNGWFPINTSFRTGASLAAGQQLEVRVPSAAFAQETHVYETISLLDGDLPKARDGAHDLDTCPGCKSVEQRDWERRQFQDMDQDNDADVDEDQYSEPPSSATPSPAVALSPSSEDGGFSSPGSPTPPSSWPSWAHSTLSDSEDEEDDWEPLSCDGVQDVVFTGETDANHGQAWHHYEYIGRVRPWDGLIGLLMRPRNRTIGLATYFISGHLVGRDTFEGTWQMAAQDVLAPSWGGSLCLARGEE